MKKKTISNIKQREKYGGILKNVTFEEQAFPKRIKIDNGSEFISKALDRWAYEKIIEFEFSRPGKATGTALLRVLTDHYGMSVLMLIGFYL